MYISEFISPNSYLHSFQLARKEVCPKTMKFLRATFDACISSQFRPSLKNTPKSTLRLRGNTAVHTRPHHPLQLRSRRPRRLHNPRPPFRLIITSPSQLTLTIPPPRLKLPPARLSPLIRISLNQRRDSVPRAHLIPQPVLLPSRCLILDIPRVAGAWPVVRRRVAAQAAAVKVSLEERAQGRGGGGGDADASFNSRPNSNVSSSVEEILDVGEVLDKRNADDCCGRGSGWGLAVCGLGGWGLGRRT